MADLHDRPFSRNYSGLVNQSVIALCIATLAITSQELMKRARRGKPEKYRNVEGVGSVETWEFGYLFQGRTWARHPSPPVPLGWPLSWVKEAITFPEDKINELRGIDAALYSRFLRGCFYFALLHTLTTLPILFPIHVKFSENDVSPRSMTRVSISSLVMTEKGLSLLWIHICLLFWTTFTWMGTLIWICQGAFKFRSQQIEAASKQAAYTAEAEKNSQYHPHPHPQYPFQTLPVLDPDHSNRGLKMRTVMVSNVLPQLRKSEKDLKEYFEWHMSRPLQKPAMGLTSSTQPGFLNKSFGFLFNRAKRLPAHLHVSSPTTDGGDVSMDGKSEAHLEPNSDKVPIIDRVVIARKMTELASLLERREEVLRRLETAHINLAKKTLTAVKIAMDERALAGRPDAQRKSSQISLAQMGGRCTSSQPVADLESGVQDPSEALESKAQMDILIDVLGPFVKEFDVPNPTSIFHKSKRGARGDRSSKAPESLTGHATENFPTITSDSDAPTVWEALHSLPRHLLHPYQPLIHLNALFRGKTVPSIDYYTAKLGLLTSLITENRSKAITDYDPVSTAFVTFADPADARRACKYLAVHPNNPLACLVTMAPGYEDLDWVRVMKSHYRAEFLKDWVVNIGVWGFTIFWLFPVSLLVGLVSIDSIGQFWPSLRNYLSNHPWEQDVIQSFLPTILVALLSILIPLILLLIAKKAHTITTLSALHDTIMTRYYKFLIVNVLVFFCVGTASVTTVLTSFKNTTGEDIIKIVADSFPIAGPFYVGWLIFTTAMHGGFELGLFGLPLIMYPTTRRQVTPRKRSVGIRPRTFNYYYWLPNHTLVIHVLLLFALLNPLVIPFALLYFSVEKTVVKNQLIHVYAKNYEGNGKLILIRLLRYSLDGLILAQAVFLAYMVVLKKKVNIGLAAVLIILTAVFKLIMTLMVRAQYERDDIREADVVCRVQGYRDASGFGSWPDDVGPDTSNNTDQPRDSRPSASAARFWTWRKPEWINFSYRTGAQRAKHPQHRQPNPFHPQRPSFSRLGSGQVPPADGLPAQPSGKPTNLTVGIDPPVLTAAQYYHERQATQSLGVVVRHPPPTAWDDDSHEDVPYDNPYYTRPISNALWLPRDPFGVLDLDDTIDLRRSLTSVPGAGQLGTWLGQSGFVHSPLPMSTPSGAPDESQPSSSISIAPPIQYDGTEEIDLPPGIATRIRSPERGDEVEHSLHRRPSMFSNRRRLSNTTETGVGNARRPGTSDSRFPSSLRRPGTGDSRFPSSLRRPGTGDSRFPSSLRRPKTGDSLLPTSMRRPGTADDSHHNFRSFSSHSGSHNQPPSSFLSVDGGRPRTASALTEDPEARPDMHAQAQFSGSTLSVVPPSPIEAPHVTTGLQPSRSLNITTQEAVVNEVIAEEHEAVQERIRQEQAEAAEQKRTKSLLTSWMFKAR